MTPRKIRAAAMYVTILVCALYGAAETAHSAPVADPCHFDHLTVTLSHDSFASIQDYFTDKKNSGLIDASWENEESSDFGGQKGFLKFANGTYMEIWDSSKMVNPGFHPDDVGFQDVCRPKNSKTIFQIAKGYGVTPTEGRYEGRLMMALAGRRGMGGDPQGGMFFMWHVNPELDRTKSGIQQILKNVHGDINGRPNSNLVSDYKEAGMKVSVRDHVLRAVDNIGVVRVATANPGYPVGLIAVRFSRQGKDSANIQVPKSSGNSEQFSLKLRPGVGALIFQSTAFETSASLLDE